MLEDKALFSAGMSTWNKVNTEHWGKRKKKPADFPEECSVGNTLFSLCTGNEMGQGAGSKKHTSLLSVAKGKIKGEKMNRTVH